MTTTTYTTVNGQILSQSKDGGVPHFVSDPLGSVVMVRDNAGNTVYEAEYDPYGNVQSETGTNPSEFGYVGTLGYVKDSAFSLYVRARYLLTNLGRWLTKDPLWPSQPGYVYSNASPSLWVDPSGLITPISLFSLIPLRTCGPKDENPCAKVRGSIGVCVAAMCSAKLTASFVMSIVNIGKGIANDGLSFLLDLLKGLNSGRGSGPGTDTCCRQALNYLNGGSNKVPTTLGGIFAYLCKSGNGKFPAFRLCTLVTNNNWDNGVYPDEISARNSCMTCCAGMYPEVNGVHPNDYSQCTSTCDRYFIP